jgi:hypothetical protein
MVLVAAGFAAWQILMNAQQVIVIRDPGTYVQFGYWIAQHGSVRIPQSAAAFGGGNPGLTFASLGFYAPGSTVVPQFMAGLPIVLAAGFWTGGTAAALVMGPLIGACAVLAFGGLVGRLAGVRWAPVGALVLALSLPEQYTSRSTFSEPLAQLLLFGGLCMLIDSLVIARGRHGRARPVTPAERTAAVALATFGGLALGLSTLVRIDGLSDLLPVLPFLGVMLAARRVQALPFGIGLVIGVGYGLADGYLLSRPYLDSLASSMRPLGVSAAGFAVVTIAATALASFRRVRGWLRRLFGRRPLRWLPAAAAALTVLAMIGFAVRPYVQTVRGETDQATLRYIAALQRLAHLPMDPRRQYAEDSLYWVIWYIGVPAVLLGAFGLALLARRCLRALLTWQDPGAAARVWALPLMIIGWVTATVLWRPGIIADQPWASRRLVPVVLPGLILCAVWTSRWLTRQARERGAGRVARPAVAACCVAALLVPTAVTTFGIGVTHGAHGSRRLTANGLAFKRTSRGEISALRGLCAGIGPNASVVIVDPLTADRFAQVIRGMCNTPTGRLDNPSPFSLQPVVAGIERAGRRPVLLAGQPDQLTVYGGAVREVLNLLTTQDAHELTQPPSRTWLIHYTVYMSQSPP